MNLNHTRRGFILTAGCFAVSSISGCCRMPQVPAAQIGETPNGAAFHPILRPKIVENPNKPTRFCVDAHAHFFNASDVNVQGYVEGPIADGYSGLFREFIRMLAPIAQELAYHAPSARGEYYKLKKMQSELALNSLRDRALNVDVIANYARPNLDESIEKHRSALAADLAASMKKKGADKKFFDLRRAAMQGDSRGRALMLNESVDFEATILEALTPKRRREQLLRSYDFSMDSSAGNGDPGGVIEFLGHMLSPRWMNLRTYAQVFSEDPGAFGVDGVFGSLVDFSVWLSGSAESAMMDQIKLQSVLSLMSGGYMLPIVGYDPWIDILYDDASLAVVQEAVINYGFVGVKIYPPNGYFPYGNATFNSKVRSKMKRPDPALLDKKLAAMFDWCASQKIQVPVMAHADDTMGRDSSSDVFAGPQGWQALLARYVSSADRPIVNLGHFGGGISRKDEVTGAWPTGFAALMNTPEGARVYGDIAYWNELKPCAPGQQHCNANTALNRLVAAKNVNPALSDHIMYGTDWFMLAMEHDWGSYPQWMADSLKDTLPKEKLYYQNVIDCFGMGKSGCNRQRIEARFAAAGIALPAWIASA